MQTQILPSVAVFNSGVDLLSLPEESSSAHAMDVGLVELGGWRPAGEAWSTQWKAWLYNSDRSLFWEMRRVCVYVGLTRGCSKLLKEKGPAWDWSLRAAGASLSDWFLPSSYCEDADLGDERIRHEYSVSSEGVLTLLVSEFFAREDTSQITSALSKLFEVALIDDKVADVFSSACAPHVRVMCGESIRRTSRGMACTHLADVCDLASAHETEPRQFLAAVILRVAREARAGRCLAASATWKGILQAFRDAAAASFHDRFDKDIFKLKMPRSCTKRLRRTDEDHRKAVIFSAHQGHMAQNSASFLRAQSQVATSGAVLGRRWDGRQDCIYLSSLWSGFEGTEVFHIAFDGARFGQPAEESLILVCCDPDTQIAGVMFQALAHWKQIGCELGGG